MSKSKLHVKWPANDIYIESYEYSARIVKRGELQAVKNEINHPESPEQGFQMKLTLDDRGTKTEWMKIRKSAINSFLNDLLCLSRTDEKV